MTSYSCYGSDITLPHMHVFIVHFDSVGPIFGHWLGPFETRILCAIIMNCVFDSLRILGIGRHGTLDNLVVPILGIFSCFLCTSALFVVEWQLVLARSTSAEKKKHLVNWICISLISLECNIARRKFKFLLQITHVSWEVGLKWFTAPVVVGKTSVEVIKTVTVTGTVCHVAKYWNTYNVRGTWFVYSTHEAIHLWGHKLKGKLHGWPCDVFKWEHMIHTGVYIWASQNWIYHLYKEYKLH